MAANIAFKTGSFKGTGALLSVRQDLVGFAPKSIRLNNLTDGSVAFWSSDMADDSMQTQKGGTTASVASGGIIPYYDGFTLGTNAFNGNGDEIHYTVLG